MNHRCGILSILSIWICLVTSSISASSLEEKFQIARPQTHHIVLLDTSGSMKPYFSQVMEAVQTLLQSLPAEDLLTAYRFDDYPVKLCGGVIKNLSPHEYLPTSVNTHPKSKTEIGETFEKVLQEIEASSAPIFTVFFLTDGKEEPRDGSKFDKTHKEAWNILSEKAKKINSQRDIWGYSLGLKQYTDVQLLSKIIPQDKIEVVTMKHPSELKGRIESLREKMRKNWLRSAVQKELREGYLEIVPVEAPKVDDRKVHLSYAIRSHYPHLDIALISFSVENSTRGKKILINDPIPVSKMAFSKPIKVSFELPVHSKMQFGRKTIFHNENLNLKGSPVFVDEKDIISLDLHPVVKVKGTEATLTYSYKTGIPFSFLIFLPLSLLGIGLFSLRWIRVPAPEVFGNLNAKDIESKHLEDYHQTVVQIGGGGQDISIPDAQGTIALEVRREGSFDTLLLRPLEGQIKLDGELLSNYGERKLQQEVAKVSLGGRELILSEINTRRIRPRAWGKLIVFAATAVAINFILWKIGP